MIFHTRGSICTSDTLPARAEQERESLRLAAFGAPVDARCVLQRGLRVQLTHLRNLDPLIGMRMAFLSMHDARRARVLAWPALNVKEK